MKSRVPGTVVSGKYWFFLGFQWTLAILAPSGKGLPLPGLPAEWPTSTVSPGCAAIARRAASDASCSEVRGFCTLVQFTPFCWRRVMTFDQQEPSANSPCTKTTFLVFGDA